MISSPPSGYNTGSLVSQLNAGPYDVRVFLAGTLDPEQTRELTDQLREAVISV
jgi:hypothetical protein